jgi:hypothetical protein
MKQAEHAIHMEERKILVRKPKGKREGHYLEDAGINGRIMLKET